MFTIKLYDDNKRRILEAESFSVYLGNGSGCDEKTGPYTHNWAEITLHNKSEDTRFDVGDSPYSDRVPTYKVAYIENALGKTVESFRYDIGPA